MLARALLPLALLLAGPADARARIGDSIDGLAITMIDHQRIDAAALRGQVVIVNFWAPWCAPCKQELPLLDAYHRAHAGEGLRVFAVSEDPIAAERLKALSASYGFDFARGVSGGGVTAMPMLPTSYVVDRAGTVRYAASGALDTAKLDEVVGPLLAAPPR